MNILLWILQVALAWLCIAGGVFQIFKLDELKKNVRSMQALPKSVWAFLGAFGCIAGVGLILPGVAGMPSLVTGVAAVAVAAQSLLISSFYVYYRDRSPLPYSAAMTLVAAFIAYGRFAVAV